MKYCRVYAGSQRRPQGLLGVELNFQDALKKRREWRGEIHVRTDEMSREAAERILRRGDYADMMRIAHAVIAQEDINADTARK